jgi:predicted porin
MSRHCGAERVFNLKRGTVMKKLLWGTTVLVGAAALTTGAHAAEWNVRVGGYTYQYFGYADNSLDGGVQNGAGAVPGGGARSPFNGNGFSGADVKSDTEVWFLPKITLDNGVEFGANIQLEGNSTGDTIDESFAFIEGSFGHIDIGSENSAGYKMSYGAPNVHNFDVSSGDTTYFAPTESAQGAQFRGVLQTTYLENARNNDTERLTYYTPRIAGFQLGASYARDGRQDDGTQVNTKTELSNIIDLGANYVQSFGDISVAVAGRYGTANQQATSRSAQVYGASGQISYAGFTLGGGYAEQTGTSNRPTGNGNSSGDVDGQAWEVGLTYQTGPWGFAVSTFQGENDDRDQEKETYQIGASYTLGPGVRIPFAIGYSNFEDGGTFGNNFEADDDLYYVVTGIELRF